MSNFLTFVIRTIVSFGLLYLALRGIDFAAIQTRLSGINLGWIALAILATAFQIFLGALRWREISRSCGASLTHIQAFRYNMVGAFFNQALPSSIGGDAMRLWLVSRTGAGWRAATYSVLTDRAVGFVALVLIIIGSLSWTYRLVDNPNGRLAVVFVDLAALAGGASFLILGYLPWAWLNSWWPTKHAVACSKIANQVIFTAQKGPKIAALSLSIHLLTIIIAWCAVRSIAAPAVFREIFLLTPPIVLITMLPISIAGWGVREATMMVAFGYAGLAPMDGTVVSILFGGISLIVGAFGGLFWIFSNERASGNLEAVRAE